jgi:hypothetical protein
MATITPFVTGVSGTHAATTAGVPAGSFINPWPLPGGAAVGTLQDPGVSGGWFSIYKTPSNTPATVTVTNTGGCGDLGVQLLDNKGTRDKSLIAKTFLTNGGKATASLPASQAENPLGLYYLELIGNGTDACGSFGFQVGYSIDVAPAGQLTVPPAATLKATQPGSSIGAAPQLLGGITYYPAAASVSSATGWYSLSKRSDATPGTIRIAVGDSCVASVTFALLDANGVADAAVTSMVLPPSSAVTFTVPGHRASDPDGIYYLTSSQPRSCTDYSIAPWPAGEFTGHQAAAWTQPLLGTSAGQAWPNLVGGRRYLPGQYPRVIPKTRWYTLGKLRETGPATVRVVDATGPGSSGCVARLYNSASAATRPIAAAVLNANEAVTFNVPARRAGGSGPIDQYYLSLTSASSCGYLSRTLTGSVIEPEPASAWGWGIHAGITGTSKSSATGIRFGLNYAGTITASRRQAWAKFNVSAPATFLGTSITSHKAVEAGGCNLGIALLDPAGHPIDTFSWGIDQVAKVPLRTQGTYYVHVWFPSSCKHVVSYAFITQVRS